MYKSAISENSENEFYTVIVRVDRDGEERVIHGYKSRCFKTRKAAERSTEKHIAKFGMND